MFIYTSEIKKKTEIETYVKLINHGKISVRDASEAAEMTEENFRKELHEITECGIAGREEIEKTLL